MFDCHFSIFERLTVMEATYCALNLRFSALRKLTRQHCVCRPSHSTTASSFERPLFDCFRFSAPLESCRLALASSLPQFSLISLLLEAARVSQPRASLSPSRPHWMTSVVIRLELSKGAPAIDFSDIAYEMSESKSLQHLLYVL